MRLTTLMIPLLFPVSPRVASAAPAASFKSVSRTSETFQEYRALRVNPLLVALCPLFSASNHASPPTTRFPPIAKETM